MGLVLGIPPAVTQLVQQGLLERSFHDGLFPALLFRADATWEEWPDHQGTEVFVTRAGQMAPNTKPLVPGADPVPKKVDYEQWVARLEQYGDTIDIHTPTSVVANADKFLKDVHQLGLQAGQSLNRLPRNSLFKAYQSGNTALIQATASGDTTIRVASLNGFTDVVIKGVTVRPSPVSSSTPLPILINGTVAKNVIGATPDDPADPYGPGTLQLDATVGSIIAVRASVLSSARVAIIRSGGGSTVDAIGTTDTFVLQDVINATNRLRKNNVQPHEDGFFHAHISTDANGQIFNDPAWQRLHTGKPDAMPYQEGFIGTIAGVAFFLNNETPDDTNTGLLTATGTNARYAEDIGAEVVNENNVRIGRVVVTGRGAIYEKSLDESKFITEAGVTGKVGEFQIVNAGIQVVTDRIRLILRAPLNRLMDQVAATWTISTSFPIPSDVASGGPERFKRAVVIEHALE